MILAAQLAHLLVTNPNIQWNVVGHYFFSPQILDGLVRTLQLTVISMAVSFTLGVILAVMRLSSNPILATASWLYIWFFRGTPLIVQIIFWYNLASLTPTLSIGVPFGPSFATGGVNTLITPFTAAVLALGLHEAAFMSEIIRTGIISVDQGQTEAAVALGMNKGQILRRIILPQSMKVIVPPTGNQTINMLKTTAIVSVIAMPELLYSAEIIYARTYQVIPLLVVASLMYLIVVSILTLGQYYLERHYARGSVRELPLTPLQRARGRLKSLRELVHDHRGVAR